MGSSCQQCQKFSNKEPEIQASKTKRKTTYTSPNEQSLPLCTNDQETVRNTQNVTKLPKILMKNGNSYEGEWLNGMRHGKGIYDGTIYDGQFVSDSQHGSGKIIYPNGDIYDGNWENDVAQGFGIFTQTNGSKYIGYWVNDRYEGNGAEEWPEGIRYDLHRVSMLEVKSMEKEHWFSLMGQCIRVNFLKIKLMDMVNFIGKKERHTRGFGKIVE